MRILHTSDWHLGKSLEQISRLAEQREFIDELVAVSDREQVELVLIAGDIYDTYNPSAAAEELFYDAVDRLNAGGRRAVVVIAGNHDNPDRLCAASPLASRRGIFLLGYPGSLVMTEGTKYPGIQIIDAGSGWLEMKIPGCPHPVVLLTLPYPSEARLEEVLSQQADERLLQRAYSEKVGGIFAALSLRFREDTVNLAVSHLFMLGGKESESERTLQVGGALTVDPRVLPANAHYVALGHLHRPQEVRSAPCPAFYSGSPLAYSFSEAEHSKAVYLVDAVPGKLATVAPVYLDCGRPLRRWQAANISQALEWCGEGRDARAWVDLEITTDRVLTLEEQKSLRSLHPGLVNIRPRLIAAGTAVFSPDKREGRRIDDLFRDYYQHRLGVAIAPELMAAFVEILNDDAVEVAGDATENPGD